MKYGELVLKDSEIIGFEKFKEGNARGCGVPKVRIYIKYKEYFIVNESIPEQQKLERIINTVNGE